MSGSNGSRVRGVVKFFNPVKGWGFIAVPGMERDVFVHKSAFDNPDFPLKGLIEDDAVEFTLDPDTTKGPKAINIKRQ